MRRCFISIKRDTETYICGNCGIRQKFTAEEDLLGIVKMGWAIFQVSGLITVYCPKCKGNYDVIMQMPRGSMFFDLESRQDY